MKNCFENFTEKSTYYLTSSIFERHNNFCFDNMARMKQTARKPSTSKSKASKSKASKSKASKSKAASNYSLTVSDYKTLLQHIDDCERSASIALAAAVRARRILSGLESVEAQVSPEPSSSSEDDESSSSEEESSPKATPNKATPKKATPAPKKLTKAVIVKMNKGDVLKALAVYGLKESSISRSDGNKGKPLIKDLRDKLVEMAEGGGESEGEESSPKATPNKGSPLKVQAYPNKGYGLDENDFVYDLKENVVVGRLVNDDVKPLVKASITKLDKLSIAYEKITAKELKTRLVPLKEIEELSDDDGSSTEEEGGPSGEVVDSSDDDPTPEDSAEEHDDEGGIVEEGDESSSDDEDDGSSTEEEGEGEFADSSPEGNEIAEKESSDEEEELAEEDEGGDIKEHFEEAPEITEAQFRKFVTAQYNGEINLADGKRVNAKKLGIDELAVGVILVQYDQLNKRWPNVVTQAKGGSKAPKAAAKPKAGGRRILKKR